MPDTKWVSKQNLQTFWEYIKDQIEEIVSHAAVGVEATWDEYEELPEEEKLNGTIYYITDKDNEDILFASDATYDNTQSGLTATDAQGAIDELNSNAITRNLKSITRVVADATTGNTGNISLPYENDGITYIVSPFSIDGSVFLKTWVSPSNNGWFLTAVNPNTGSTINNTNMRIRYLVVKIYSAT